MSGDSPPLLIRRDGELTFFKKAMSLLLYFSLVAGYHSLVEVKNIGGAACLRIIEDEPIEEVERVRISVDGNVLHRLNEVLVERERAVVGVGNRGVERRSTLDHFILEETDFLVKCVRNSVRPSK